MSFAAGTELQLLVCQLWQVLLFTRNISNTCEDVYFGLEICDQLTLMTVSFASVESISVVTIDPCSVTARFGFAILNF